MDTSINDFIIFCLEMYKYEHGLSGKEVYELFERHNVFQFLSEVYDVLHTQGHYNILETIKDYISKSLN
jgi:hypothetical protein